MSEVPQREVKMFDYREQHARLRAELDAAIARVLASGRLILGPEVEAFERAFSDWLGLGPSAVGVNSGTDALIIALRALGIGEGDEVVTVANTAVPTVSAIRALGAVPRFCDIEPRTGLMDLARLPRLLGPNVKAVVPVHLYGNMVDVERLRALLDGRPISIVEDCAQSHGARMRGRLAGTLGDAAAFSFYPTKNLGAYGDAGACVSADAELVLRMRSIRMYGFEGQYYAEREGINSRLDPLQAAILGVKLRYVDEFVERRRALAARYDANLCSAARRVVSGVDVAHAYHLYVVRVADRERVRAALHASGVETAIHYPFPIHLMRGYARLGYAPGSLQHTEAAAAEVLSLPLYPELRESDVDRVCLALEAALRR
ncbi:MAG: DegT/DnrJ/EryC1/StrS family aminotransferase [Planctomycetes bacterium]|nr:DegT/DnrJ/EryC1/StrS family aminotransferase [Planctomycetota bacterium]